MHILRTIAVLAAALMVSAPMMAAAQDAPPAGDPAPAVEEAAPVEEAPVAPAEVAPEATEGEMAGGEDLGVEAEYETEPAGAGPIYTQGGLFGAGVVIGAKVGGGFGQLTSPLGTSFVGELELGYTLPLPDPVNRDIEIFLAGQYAGPSTDETISEPDARLPGDGTWTYELTHQQVLLTLGMLYRIPVPVDWVRPYVAAGGRMAMSRTEVTGEAGGMPFGDNEETATNWGGYGALGGDFFVGPGSILFEVQFGFVPLDGKVLANTNSGALNVALGYRFFL